MENQKEEEKPTTDDSGDGNQPEESKEVAKLRKENERMEKQLAKKKELLTERMELEARETLSGRAEAGMAPPAPKKESDDEYAERVRKGEANPLKEDGFIR